MPWGHQSFSVKYFLCILTNILKTELISGDYFWGNPRRQACVLIKQKSRIAHYTETEYHHLTFTGLNLYEKIPCLNHFKWSKRFLGMLPESFQTWYWTWSCSGLCYETFLLYLVRTLHERCVDIWGTWTINQQIKFILFNIFIASKMQVA